jgi:hypothetical protein
MKTDKSFALLSIYRLHLCKVNIHDKPLSFVPVSFLARDYNVFKENSNTRIKPEKMRSFSFSAPCIG